MQDDVLVGAPMAGRSRKAFSPLVGYFVNPVVLRGRLADNPTFVGYLQQTRRTVADALEHQDVPFPLLVERLKPTRDAGRSPFFQAMFSLQLARDKAVGGLGAAALGAPGDRVQWQTLALEGYPLPRRIAQFDLTLQVAEIGESADWLARVRRGSVRCGDAAADDGALRRVAAQHRRQSDEPRQIALAGLRRRGAQADRHLEPNRANLPAGGHGGRAVGSPGRAAIRTHSRWSGARLASPTASSMSAPPPWRWRLHAAGIGAGSTVALFVPRSVEMIVAVLGVLKIGAVYVPLDLRTPRQRIAYVVKDCAAAGLLTSGALLDRLPPLDCAIHCVDGEEDATLTSSAPAVVCPAGPESAAYVIYTSGTTGQPKGVVVLHRNVVHYAQSAAEVLGIGRSDRVLQFASLAFDVSVEEIFTTLTSGGTLVLRDDAMLESASIFLARCGALGITVLDLPTAYWHELVASASPEDWRQATALRAVLIAGEKATVERLRRWHQNVGSRLQLLNRYGPTEATVIATVEDLTHLTLPELATMTEVSIGRPYPNCQVYILDTELKPVPTGAPGELYIGGAGVADGYLNAPELTASRFLPDPFADDPGRTALSHRRQGAIPGRRSHPVPRTARSPGQDPRPSGRARRDRDRARRTSRCARRGRRRGRGGLERAASRRLPRMRSSRRRCRSSRCAPSSRSGCRTTRCPAVFVGLTALPMSSSGKINRNLLPRPSLDNTLRDESHVPPRNPLEERMTEVWKRVLKIDQVGVHDNFFDVGGHSLLLPCC